MFVLQYIMSYQIFGTTVCPYTTAAVEMLPEASVVYLDESKGGAQLRRKLQRDTKQKTVPYVFYDGAFLGGFHNINLTLYPELK
jgi:glutaredoxin